VTRDGDHLVVRVFNPHPEATSVAVATDGGAAHGAVVDLVDTATDAFDGRLVVPPGAIRTLRLA
jgi:hypothetical protein